MMSVSPLKDENGSKVLTAKTASGKKKADDQQELLRCKRRINFQSLGYNIPQPAPQSVARRNERERNRVKLVNTGFAQLREHVPNGSKNKKMSKVETLKSAIEYIRELQRLLDENEAAAAYATVTLRTHYSPDSYITSSPHSYPSPQSYHQPSPTSFYDPTSPQYTVAPSTHFYKQFKLDSHQQNENVHYQAGQIGRSSYHGGTMSTGSPSPSYMSDTSTGDGPTSPKEEDVMEFASWFAA